MNAVLLQYLETILWVETDPNGGPLDRSYDYTWFSKESVARAQREITDFFERVDEAILVIDDMAEEASVDRDSYEFVKEYVGEFDDTDVARDFWLTRNETGTTFRDRPEKYGARLAKALTNLAHNAGKRYVMVGDDGELHIEGE